MLSTHAVNHSSASAAFQAQVVGNNSVPETGMFDFMNYLLGLQGTPQGSALDMLMPQTDVPIANGKSGMPETSEDPLLSLFGKKGDPLGDSMQLGSLANPNFNTLSVGNLGKIDEAMASDKAELKAEADTKAALSSALNERSLHGPDSLRDRKGESNEITDGPVKESAFSKMQKENAIQKYSPKTTQTQMVTEDKTTTPVTYAQRANQAPTPSEANQAGEQSQIVSHSDLLKNEIQKSDEPDRKHVTKEESFNAIALGLHDKANVSANDELGKTNAKPEVVRSTLPELFDKVQTMVHHGNGKMTVSLTPASLGHVEIQVTTRGKNVEIQMKSENDFAKSALESSLSELKSSMQAQDLHLSKMEVQVSREVDRNFGTGQFTTMTGHENSFQQSQSFTRENAHESPWREPSGFPIAKASVTPSSQGSMRTLGNYVSGGSSRVDIRI